MGVDVARMKIEFLAAWRRTHGLGLRERLVAYLPRYAPWASRAHGLVNLRNRSRVLAWFGERAAGLSARRPLPEWKPDRLGTPHGPALRPGGGGGSDGEGRVILFVDTFSRYFESENVRAATSVLEAAGRPVRLAAPSGGRRPLCCGRTFLNVGLVEEAKVEARRTLAALLPEVERGTPVVGIEPSCLLTFRDEYAALLPGEGAEKLAGAAVLVEELLARDRATGRPGPALAPLANPRIRIHGHCHQKALDAMDAVPEVLSWIPGADVSLLESGCCGMAGSFGYEAEHHDVSMAMAELELLPAVRETPEGDWLVADGTSCRRQIHDGAGREAFHAVRVLEAALASPPVR